ncbi:mechanosensitive ion channel family protein [Govanella unica]|uniref:Mechanosensitive ion channel n=1 Tax=Govanella unica TaxID=2975056 RepID=A0A9X3TX74_9PROT|nr:mechanosensitive ion channel domain-containing protein [Govania unica]MDA5193332.1 mechanosensitive ion channel [Govania unica]
MFAPFQARFQGALDGVSHWALAPETLAQIVAALTGLLLALLLGRILRPLVWRFLRAAPTLDKSVHVLKPLLFPLVWLVVTAGAIVIFNGLDIPVYVLRPLARLLLAWVLIRGASLFIRNPDLAQLFAVMAWLLVALSTSGFLDPIVALLDSADISVGTTRLSALMIITAVLTFGVVIWIALFVSRLIEQSLSRFPTMTPSAQLLLGKVMRVVLITVAFLVAMSSLGINLTALAVLGGAVGVGLGFGLQKVVSNLISGVILLIDGSIKPGDVIEVGETYGWINKLAARYTSVITRDGREHLIPNEDMITQPVINWTYSSTKVRRHIPIPVSYDADLHHVMRLVLEAASETPRVLADPAVKCLVREFGESMLILELRIWISDPHNGVRNVASDVQIKVWDKFHEAGIDFPKPRRDIHMIRRDETGD